MRSPRRPYCRQTRRYRPSDRPRSHDHSEILRCVKRCCPSPAEARSSETYSLARTCAMQARMRGSEVSRHVVLPAHYGPLSCQETYLKPDHFQGVDQLSRHRSTKTSLSHRPYERMTTSMIIYAQFCPVAKRPA